MLLANKICDHLEDRIQKGELDNQSLIQIIELIGRYLNIQTIPDYAKSNGMSYNGAKKFRKVVKIFKVRFVIDNE
jgi:hypothetical protein